MWTSFHWTLGLSSSLSLFVPILSASVALLPLFHSNSAQQDKTTARLNTNHPGPGPAELSEGLALKPAPGPHRAPRLSILLEPLSQAGRTLEDRDPAAAAPAPAPELSQVGNGDFLQC